MLPGQGHQLQRLAQELRGKGGLVNGIQHDDQTAAHQPILFGTGGQQGQQFGKGGKLIRVEASLVQNIGQQQVAARQFGLQPVSPQVQE